MKTFTVWGSLALVAFANAQYFSAGWSPGQPAQKASPSAASVASEAASSPTPVPLGGSPFDVKNILSSGPVVSLFARFGVNITERVGRIANTKYWDDRVPLITDGNYGNLIVNETMTASEEKNRMWFIVMYAFVSPPPTPLS
jgi:hypothetical protein